MVSDPFILMPGLSDTHSFRVLKSTPLSFQIHFTLLDNTHPDLSPYSIPLFITEASELRRHPERGELQPGRLIALGHVSTAKEPILVLLNPPLSTDKATLGGAGL